MGVIASLIKLMVAFFVGFIPSVYNPAIYIIVESLCMFGALAIFKPKDVLSLRTLASVIVANTLYQASFFDYQNEYGRNKHLCQPNSVDQCWGKIFIQV